MRALIEKFFAWLFSSSIEFTKANILAAMKLEVLNLHKEFDTVQTKIAAVRKDAQLEFERVGVWGTAIEERLGTLETIESLERMAASRPTPAGNHIDLDTLRWGNKVQL